MWIHGSPASWVVCAISVPSTSNDTVGWKKFRESSHNRCRKACVQSKLSFFILGRRDLEWFWGMQYYMYEWKERVDRCDCSVSLPTQVLGAMKKSIRKEKEVGLCETKCQRILCLKVYVDLLSDATCSKKSIFFCNWCSGWVHFERLVFSWTTAVFGCLLLPAVGNYYRSIRKSEISTLSWINTNYNCV